MEQITFNDFEKIDIRAGTIVKSEPFPQARKPAYKIWVDFGPEVGILKTSAQVTHHYTLETLVNMRVLGLTNVGTKNIAGFTSEFLLLGLEDTQGAIQLVTFNGDVPNGNKLK